MAGGVNKWSKAAAKGGVIGIARQAQRDRREAAEKSGLETRREQHVEAEDLDGPDARSSLVDVAVAQPNDEGPSAITYDVDAEDEVDDGGGSPRRDLKQLAKDQMGKVERVGAGGGLRSIERLLAKDECVDLLFGCQINGKQAALALTDRRLLAAYGMLGRSDTIDYQSIGQVNTGLTKVEIKGAGVSLTLKAVGRKDELVRALNQRRQAPPNIAAAPAAPPQSEDPVALLEKLGRLREQGVLTEAEFAAKKAELLDRM